MFWELTMLVWSFALREVTLFFRRSRERLESLCRHGSSLGPSL